MRYLQQYSSGQSRKASVAGELGQIEFRVIRAFPARRRSLLSLWMYDFAGDSRPNGTSSAGRAAGETPGRRPGETSP
jgi:hypothetical protein